MNFTQAHRKRTPVALEITPLIDVVFLLLIFFLLTATYVTTPNFDVTLPQAEAPRTQQKRDDLVVFITKDGTFQIDGVAVSRSALADAMRTHLKKAGKQAAVVVKADKRATHGTVVFVMDTAQKVGFSRLAVAVEEAR